MGERPIYETPADLEREAEVARRLEAKWNAEAVKLARSYKVDYAFVRDGKTVRAFAEIKVRSYSWERLHELGGYAISMAKWQAARAFCEAGELPFILAVSAAGDIRFASTRTFEHDGLVMGGRKDRGDWQDTEPMVLLGVDRFRPLEPAPAKTP